MGFNTPVLILNDALHLIENDREFGKNIAKAIFSAYARQQPIDIGVSGHCNAATVLPPAHADVVQVIAFGGNHASTLMRIGNGGHHYTSEEQMQLVKDLADQYGFRLVKKTAK